MNVLLYSHCRVAVSFTLASSFLASSPSAEVVLATRVLRRYLLALYHAVAISVNATGMFLHHISIGPAAECNMNSAFLESFTSRYKIRMGSFMEGFT